MSKEPTVGYMIDLSNLTKEEIEAISSIGVGKGNSKGSRMGWKNYTEEEKEARIKRTWGSPEAESRRRESIKRSWVTRPESELSERNNKISFSLRERWSNKSEDERSEWYETIGKPNLKIANGVVSLILSDPVKRVEWVNRSLNTPSSKLKAVGNNPSNFSKAEKVLESFLEVEFPGIFGYNGRGDLNVCVGLRIPDFVRLGGVKEVISLFNDRVKFGDIEEEIEYYYNYGYRCLILLNGELDFRDNLRFKIQEFLKSKEV